jgi:hypothetical protein
MLDLRNRPLRNELLQGNRWESECLLYKCTGTFQPGQFVRRARRPAERGSAPHCLAACSRAFRLMTDRIYRVQSEKLNDFANNPFGHHTHFKKSSRTFVAVRVPLLSKIGNLFTEIPGASTHRHIYRRPGRFSSSSNVLGQSAPKRRESPRSASTLPPVWQRAQ